MVVKQEQDLPKHCRMIWEKAVNAQQLGNLEYTIQLLQRLLKQYPEFLAARQLLRHVAISKIGNSKNNIRKVSQIFFLFLKAWWMRQRRSLYVLVIIEKILEFDPYNRSANWLLYLTSLTHDMSETAGFALETLLKGSPGDINALHKLAEHCVQEGAPQRAIKIYDRILAIASDDATAIRARKDAVAQASLCKIGEETAV